MGAKAQRQDGCAATHTRDSHSAHAQILLFVAQGPQQGKRGQCSSLHTVAFRARASDPHHCFMHTGMFLPNACRQPNTRKEQTAGGSSNCERLLKSRTNKIKPNLSGMCAHEDAVPSDLGGTPPATRWALFDCFKKVRFVPSASGLTMNCSLMGEDVVYGQIVQLRHISGN